MNKIEAIVWTGAAATIGGFGLSILVGPKGDWTGWAAGFGFLAASAGAGLFARSLWRQPGPALFPKPTPVSAPPVANDAPGAWKGPRVPLEQQIEALASAGLQMLPGRTVDELLTSWTRDQFETDPYGLLLFCYGSEVEAEPWGRYYTSCGWDFDAECLSERGDYVRAMTEIVRITGQPERVTDMSDDFNFKARTCTLKYTVNGQRRSAKAVVDNDWADPEAMALFVTDVEDGVGDGRRFWAADNGQASTLFFVSDEVAAAVNALRPDLLQLYVSRSEPETTSESDPE